MVRGIQNTDCCALDDAGAIGKGCPVVSYRQGFAIRPGAFMDFHERKKWRKEYFERFVKGWKLETCIACNGSGKYDSSRSPNCSSCEGTGKVRVKPNDKQ